MREAWVFVLFAGRLAACAEPEPPPLPTAVEVEGATLVSAGGQRVTAERATLEGDTVRAEAVVVQDGPTLEIRARRSEWDLAGGTARFTGEVVAIRRDVELRCDRLEVTVGPDGAVRHATASGALTLRTGTREARAEKAELDVKSGELVLTGAPQIRDGARVLTGDRILVELDGGRAVCEGDPCKLVVPEDIVRATPAPATPAPAP